jgi:hypothetical protein
MNDDATPMALLFLPLYTIGFGIGLIGAGWAAQTETSTLDVPGFAPPARE